MKNRKELTIRYNDLKTKIECIKTATGDLDIDDIAYRYTDWAESAFYQCIGGVTDEPLDCHLSVVADMHDDHYFAVINGLEAIINCIAHDELTFPSLIIDELSEVVVKNQNGTEFKLSDDEKSTLTLLENLCSINDIQYSMFANHTGVVCCKLIGFARKVIYQPFTASRRLASLYQYDKTNATIQDAVDYANGTFDQSKSRSQRNDELRALVADINNSNNSTKHHYAAIAQILKASRVHVDVDLSNLSPMRFHILIESLRAIDLIVNPEDN